MEGDVVAQFTEITGSTPELATQYLQITDFNIEQAMQLFFENGGAELAEQPSQQAPPPQSATHPPAYEDNAGAIHLDSDDDDDDIAIDESRSSAAPRPTAPTAFEDDAAMAQRLQEELFSGGDSLDEIRAPMARTTETLVGPGADMFDDGDMHSAILNQLRSRQSRSSSCHSPTLT
jgi:hypothetical protein